VQDSGGRLQLNWSIGENLRLLPTCLFVEVDGKHVVRENFTEYKFLFQLGLNFANIDLFDLKIGSFECI
jgi:hypothetical protein